MRNAKKRQRYAAAKEAEGVTPKPKKVNKSKAAEAKPALDSTQLNLVIAGVSSAIASRPGCEHWLLTEGEINSITKPLSAMIAESTLFAGVGQYSNQIALVMACLTVFGPRLLITVQKSKEAKKNARTGQSTNTTVNDSRLRSSAGETKNSNSGTDRRNEPAAAPDGAAHGKNVPFYGLPIC